MRITVPYRRQHTPYSCAAAAVRMILWYFKKPPQTEAALTRRMHTSAVTGTRHKEIINVFREEGLYVYAQHNASLDLIRFFLAMKLPVLPHVMELSGEESHYVVVTGITDTRIRFHDPLDWPDFSSSHEAFMKRWHDGKNIHVRWLLVASPAPLFPGARFKPLLY